MACTGNRLGRRGFLSVGAVGALGISLADVLRMEHAKADIKNYASPNSIFIIHLSQ